MDDVINTMKRLKNEFRDEEIEEYFDLIIKKAEKNEIDGFLNMAINHIEDMKKLENIRNVECNIETRNVNISSNYGLTREFLIEQINNYPKEMETIIKINYVVE